MIILDYLKQPDEGAVMFMRCDVCRTTTIIHSKHAIRPVDGNAWLVRGICDKMHWPSEKPSRFILGEQPTRWMSSSLLVSYLSVLDDPGEKSAILESAHNIGANSPNTSLAFA